MSQKVSVLQQLLSSEILPPPRQYSANEQPTSSQNSTDATSSILMQLLRDAPRSPTGIAGNAPINASNAPINATNTANAAGTVPTRRAPVDPLESELEDEPLPEAHGVRACRHCGPKRGCSTDNLETAAKRRK